MNRLFVDRVAVERGGRLVFSGISFELGNSALLTVTGANGAGKSSLLRALAGLLPIAEGRIVWDGENRAPSEHVHYLGHLDGLKPQLTVAANLHLWSAIEGEPGLPIIEALEEVELDHIDDMPAGYLSAGQRRRVALARMLVVRRPLWLLDEPTSALDASSEVNLGRLLRDHLANSGLAIVATHRPLPVEASANLDLGTTR